MAYIKHFFMDPPPPKRPPKTPFLDELLVAGVELWPASLASLCDISYSKWKGEKKKQVLLSRKLENGDVAHLKIKKIKK